MEDVALSADLDHALRWWTAEAVLEVWAEPVTEALTTAGGLGHRDTVLDLTARAGGLSLRLSQAVGPAGRVMACDGSPAMLSVINSRVSIQGIRNVTTVLGRSADVAVHRASCHAAFCRFGLHHSPHPARLLRTTGDLLIPGGRLCVAGFSTPAANPAFAIALGGEMPFIPDRFALEHWLFLGEGPAAVRLLERAGYTSVTCVSVPIHLRVTTAAELLRVLELVLHVPSHEEAARAACVVWRAQALNALAVYEDESGWTVPFEAIVLSGVPAARTPLS